MKERYKLFENLEMERLERLREKRRAMPVEFGLSSEDRVSILKVEDREIVLLEGHYSTRYFEERKNEQTGEVEKRSKYVFKFKFTDEEKEYFTITTSQSLIDRIEEALPLTPCICSLIKQRSRYSNKLYYVLK